MPEELESEKGDGDTLAKYGNTEFEKQVRTKEGDDGVEETHVTYVKRSTKKFFMPK